MSDTLICSWDRRQGHGAPETIANYDSIGTPLIEIDRIRRLRVNELDNLVFPAFPQNRSCRKSGWRRTRQAIMFD